MYTTSEEHTLSNSHNKFGDWINTYACMYRDMIVYFACISPLIEGGTTIARFSIAKINLA